MKKFISVEFDGVIYDLDFYDDLNFDIFWSEFSDFELPNTKRNGILKNPINSYNNKVDDIVVFDGINSIRGYITTAAYNDESYQVYYWIDRKWLTSFNRDQKLKQLGI